MNRTATDGRIVTIMRWVARVWSLLIFAFALLKLLTPDPYATGAVPLVDWFLLSLWGIAILGLVVAWRWELVGGILTIVTMFVRELAWVLLKGRWLVDFLIIWAFLVPPAVLFLLAWWLEHREQEG